MKFFINNSYSKNHNFNHYRALLLVQAKGADLIYLPSLSYLLIELLRLAKQKSKNSDPDNKIEAALYIIAKPKDHTIEDVANALTFLGNSLPVELLYNMFI